MNNKNPILAQKLKKMALADQKMRRRSARTGVWDARVDRHHTRELKSIVKRYGWPTISLVGKRASFHAWLIAQHADHDLTFQKRVLKMITNLWEKDGNDIDRKHIAFLEDRVSVAERKPQRFGTQFYVNRNGIFGPRRIRSMKNMESLRGEYGLLSFGEYVQAMKRYKPAISVMRGRGKQKRG